MEDDKEQSKPAEKPSGYVKRLIDMARAKGMRVTELNGPLEEDIKQILKDLKASDNHPRRR